MNVEYLYRLPLEWQHVQLSQRDRAVSWNLVTCCSCTTVRKSHLQKLAISYWPIWAVSKTFPLLQYKRLPVTFRSHSISIRQLNYKLHAFYDSRKHIAINTCYISRNMGDRKALDSKSDLQGHLKSPVSVQFDRPYTTSLQLQPRFFYLLPFSRYYQILPNI